VTERYAVYAVESLVYSKTVTQSSTYNDWNATLAIDGNFSTCMSSGPELMPWWQVDLGNFYHVIGLELFTRTDLECQQDHAHASDTLSGLSHVINSLLNYLLAYLPEQTWNVNKITHAVCKLNISK